MYVLVTGGAGFIGSHVAERLVFHHYADTCILDNLSTGKASNVDDRIPILQRDVCNQDQVDDVFERFEPRIVIHLAAQPAISTSWHLPDSDAQTNIMGTINICKACKKYNVQTLVFASTSAVYADDCEVPLHEESELIPSSPYGVSKMTAEHYIRLLMPRSTILRFGNVYGPKQVPLGENQIIPRLIRHLAGKGEFVIHGDGQQKRDFVFVKDVASAVCIAALDGAPGTYNIASGNSISVIDLVNLICELHHKPLLALTHTQEQDPRRDSRMAVHHALSRLGWDAKFSLEDGLKLTLEWWHQNKQLWD